MLKNNFVTPLLSFVIMMPPCLVQAQRATIPEMIARGAVTATSTIPSGVPPSVGEVLRTTEMIVTGTIGQPRSYLSKDQSEVYTDYPISAPTVHFQSQVITTRTPAVPPPLAVTLRGGTVTVNGLRFTQTEPGLPPLQPGTQGLFLLQHVVGKHLIAGMFLGAFSIVDGRIVPLFGGEDFAPEYRNLTLSEAIESMLTILRARVR